ncbi:hypothetical protein NPIL_88701 [Nephila pilipes]|uniref:Uncharacterized protein n=1 Tax=Nephila pilipes TaxID=299642 RepID=A0A8X6TC48_NEPPI|nr:hypothetical protein NPIL_88701 [Nephila pilipes]
MLSAEEFKGAEIKVMFIVQKSSFSSSNDERLRNIPYVVDKNGLLRMKTRLTFREDTEDFKFPIILPSNQPVIKKNHRNFSWQGGIVRLTKVRTASGEILRPIQRLYSLEINSVSGDSLHFKAYRQTGTSAQAKKMDQTSRTTHPIQTTRLGRKIKAVQILNL